MYQLEPSPAGTALYFDIISTRYSSLVHSTTVQQSSTVPQYRQEEAHMCVTLFGLYRGSSTTREAVTLCLLVL